VLGVGWGRVVGIGVLGCNPGFRGYDYGGGVGVRVIGEEYSD